MRRARRVLQRRIDYEVWREKAPTLGPGYDREARFVSVVVLHRRGGALQSDAEDFSRSVATTLNRVARRAHFLVRDRAVGSLL